MSKRRKILISLALTLGLLIVVAIPTAYYFGLSYGWSFAVSMAKDYGVVLTKKDLSIRWLGGLHFSLVAEDIGIRFEPNGKLPVRGTILIPRLMVDAVYFRGKPRVLVHDLDIIGINGSVAVDLPVAHEQTVSKSDEKPFEIPDLASVQFNVPKFDVGLEVRNFKIETSQLQVEVNRKPAVYQLQWDALKLSGGGKLVENDAEGGFQVHLVNARGGTDGMGIEGLSFDLGVRGVVVGATEKSVTVRIIGENEVRFTKFKFQGSGESAISMSAEKGKLSSKLSEKGPEFLAEIQKISGVPGIKREVALKADVVPTVVSNDLMKIDFQVSSSGLIDGRGEIVTPRRVDQISAQARGDLKLTVQSSLIGMFMEAWPKQLNGPLSIAVQADRSGDIVRGARLKVSSRWLNAEINGSGHPQLQTGDASGFVGVQLPSGVQFFGKRFSGAARIPFKALVRGTDRVYLEGTPEFQNFSFRSDDFQIQSLTGQIFVSQAWSVGREGWKISPVHDWNPFNRVDLDSSEALDLDQKILTAQKIVFQGQELGPLRLNASFKQNLLFIPSWSLQCPTGRFQGVLLSDVQLDRPRVGISVNAIEVDMSKVLPQTMLQGRRIQPDPTSFSLSLDWDLMKAQAAGSFDWIQMTPGQVFNALDFLDPLAEKPAFNTARSLLTKAYPTRVLMNFRGAVADINISTNIVQIPSVNNVAISPYLIKFREDLFQTQFIKNLKSSEELPTTTTLNNSR